MGVRQKEPSLQNQGQTKWNNLASLTEPELHRDSQSITIDLDLQHQNNHQTEPGHQFRVIHFLHLTSQNQNNRRIQSTDLTSGP